MSDLDVENFASWTRRLSSGQADADLDEASRGLHCNDVPTASSPGVSVDPLELETRWALENALEDPETLKKEILEQTTRRLACESGDVVSSRHREILNKLDHDSGNLLSILQSRKPVSLILRKKSILSLLALCCLAIAFQIASGVVNVFYGQLSKYQHFRVITLDSAKLDGTDIPDFHLMRDGCVVGSFINPQTNNQLVKSTEEPVAINGWIIDRNGIFAAFETTISSSHNSTVRRLSQLGTSAQTHAISTTHEHPAPRRAVAAAEQPTAFRLDASNDLKTWVPVASSTWRHSSVLKASFLDGAISPPSAEQEGLSILDMRPPVGLVFFHVVGGSVKLILFVLVLCFALYGKARRAAAILVHSLLVDFFVAVLALAGLLRSPSSSSTSALFLPAVSAVYAAYAFATLKLRPRRVIFVCVAAALLPLATILDLTQQHVAPSSIPVEALALSPYLLLLLLGCVGVLRRYQLLNTAKHKITADRERYKQAWAECGGRRSAAGQDAFDRALTEVTTLLSTLSERLALDAEGRPRHLVWRRAEAKEAKPRATTMRQSTMQVLNVLRRANSIAHHDWGVSVTAHSAGGSGLEHDGLLGREEEVCDLDQAFLQARAVDPFLRVKVWQWGKAARGMLPVVVNAERWESRLLGSQGSSGAAKRGASFPPARGGRGGGGGDTQRGGGGGGEERERKGEDVRFVKVVDVGEGDRIQWAGLKGVERAMNKLESCYEGKVSRLTDLSRQRLVFASLHDLLTCVRTVVCDPDVIVRGVKNGLRSEYHGEWSAGFRAVVLHLSILNAQTSSLSLSLHVVELQLLLLPVAQVLAVANHDSYLVFRNARALKVSTLSHVIGTQLLGFSMHERDEAPRRTRKWICALKRRLLGGTSAPLSEGEEAGRMEEGRASPPVQAGRAFVSGKRQLPAELFAQGSSGIFATPGAGGLNAHPSALASGHAMDMRLASGGVGGGMGMGVGLGAAVSSARSSLSRAPTTSVASSRSHGSGDGREGREGRGMGVRWMSRG